MKFFEPGSLVLFGREVATANRFSDQGRESDFMEEEWLNVVKRLWTEDDEFDHAGKYYKIVKGYLQPKPIQSCPPPGGKLSVGRFRLLDLRSLFGTPRRDVVIVGSSSLACSVGRPARNSTALYLRDNRAGRAQM